MEQDRRQGDREDRRPEDPLHLGPYRITYRLGTGAMGIVYAAVDERLGRRVAIKVIATAAASSAPERFRRESKALARVNHPNVCQIYDIGEQDGRPFLVMEYLEGESLEARVARGSIPAVEAIRIMLDVLSGLEAIHACGLLHRDLKPGNVILTDRGVKIVDFGLARIAQWTSDLPGSLQGAFQGALTSPGAIVGTPRYMAPEQLRGDPLDGRCDLFASGAIFYELITGYPAFPGPGLAEVTAQILQNPRPHIALPAPLDEADFVLQLAITTNPAVRYASARQMADDLSRILEKATQARPVADAQDPNTDTVLSGPLPGIEGLAFGRIGGYRILRRIASGATGSVYLAEPTAAPVGSSAREHVAIKVLDPVLLEREGILSRFLQEAEIGSRVVSPNVVRVHKLDRTMIDGQQFHFIVMEYVDGQTLRGLLTEMGRVPETLCRQIAVHVARGLKTIHSLGILHRDLKPENIQITLRNEIKVMDLGIALVKDRAARLTRPREFVGSIPYASPEQLRSEPLDTRSDLFSLGIVLYELATGVHPFSRTDLPATMHALLEEEPSSASTFQPQLSPFFDSVVASLLAKDRSRRFESAAELVDVLDKGEQSDWWAKWSGEIPAASRRPLRRLRVRRETGLHGRDAEMREMRERIAWMREGKGQVILIEGEPGIGKSRLVAEAVGEVEDAPIESNILMGAFQPGGLASISDAFGSAFLEYFGIGNLEARLLSHLPGMPLVVPGIASLLRGDPAPGGQQPLNLTSVQTALAQMLRSLAQDRPTVLVIEDLHNAPQQARALFAAISRSIAGSRVLLIGTTRTDADADWAGLLSGVEWTTRLSLGRLGAKDLQSLLRDVLKSESLADEIGARIALKSDGNPLFALAILQNLRETGVIKRREDGAWQRTSAIRHIEIPSGVRDLINSRLSGIDEEDRDVLEVAACLGYSFDPLLVAEALGTERIPFLKRLSRLERSRKLIRAVGHLCEFDQHQVQEYLYGELSEPLREEYHALLAVAIESRLTGAADQGTPPRGDLAVALCEHFLKGQRGQKAFQYLTPALEHLERTAQASLVVDFTGRMLALWRGMIGAEEHAELLIRRARSLSLLGEGNEALSALEQARPLAEGLDRQALLLRVRGAIGDVHLLRWDHDAARAAFEDALALVVDDTDPSLEVRLLNGLGSAQMRLRQFSESLSNHEKAMEIARRRGDDSGEANAEEGRARSLLNLGRLDESMKCRSRAIQMFHDIGDRASEAAAITNVGIFHTRNGDYERSVEFFSEGAAVFRSLGHTANEALATEAWARAQACLGRYDEALHRMERCLAIYRETGNLQKTGLTLNQTATWQAFLGDFGAARLCLEEAIDILRRLGLVHRVGESLCGLGFVAEQDEDLDSALERYEEARAHCQEADCTAVLEATLYIGRIRIRQKRLEEARVCLESIEGTLAQATDPELYVLLRSYQALLDPRHLPAALEAHAAQERRMEYRTRMECRYVQWRTSRNPDHLQQATELLVGLEGQIPEDLRSKVFATVPLYRGIRDTSRSGLIRPIE